MSDSELSHALAMKLRALRAERGWSLDQLAVRSGVSKGVLVALEQARSNPNLTTLVRISNVFGVSLTQLFDAVTLLPVQITDLAQSRAVWRGTAGGSAIVIATITASRVTEVWRLNMLPGETFSGTYAAVTTSTIWVEEGIMTLVVSGDCYRVGSRSGITFSGGSPYSCCNDGNIPILATLVHGIAVQ